MNALVLLKFRTISYYEFVVVLQVLVWFNFIFFSPKLVSLHIKFEF